MSVNINCEKVLYDCPFCDKEHDIEIRTRSSKMLIKNEPLEYVGTFYYCPVEDEEFAPAKVNDENILAAKDQYRKMKNLLTSDEIKEIRQYYDLTQKELSNLLGWGGATIQRYETKLIQDETYDSILRMIYNNPNYALELLDRHKSMFEATRYNEIRVQIKNKIKLKGIYNLTRQKIQSLYVDFDEKSDLNGFKILDIDKIDNILGFFANYINPLFKVKTMKLLWYADAIFYKRYNCAITGLVYQHLPLGAVPIAFNEILELPSIKVIEEIGKDDNVRYRITADKAPCIDCFSIEELDVLQEVVRFFKDMNTQDIVDYMHKEKAYELTSEHDIIPFSLSKDIYDF